jgi:hypothetical protein
MWGIIGRFVISLIGPVLAKIFAGLGIGLVSYTGATLVLDQVRDWVLASFSGLSSNLVNIIYLIGLDEGIKILFAAYSVKIGLQLTMGAFKRLSIGGTG